MPEKKNEKAAGTERLVKKAIETRVAKAVKSAQIIKSEKKRLIAKQSEQAEWNKDLSMERPPRYSTEEGAMAYETETRADAASNGGQNIIREILKGEAAEDRGIILRGLLSDEKASEQKARAKRRVINPDIELSDDWQTGGYPYKNHLRRKVYEREKFQLQVELLKLQNWVTKTGSRVVILFEGRDAAGKGGTITRFMEHMNPRGARIVALPKPTVAETGQWYFQRYVKHLPTSGEIVLFDRSWYNRAVVERVMGFCTDEQYHEFMREVPDFERFLVNSGIYLIKFWFSVSREEQRRRFKEREVHPLKRWKLSPVDLASLDKWDEYTAAKDAMFDRTDTVACPWTVVKSDDKKRARLNAMRYVLNTIPYDNRDETVVGPVDPLIVGRATAMSEAARSLKALQSIRDKYEKRLMEFAAAEEAEENARKAAKAAKKAAKTKAKAAKAAEKPAAAAKAETAVEAAAEAKAEPAVQEVPAAAPEKAPEAPQS